jgi:hypothetical protein
MKMLFGRIVAAQAVPGRISIQYSTPLKEAQLRIHTVKKNLRLKRLRWRVALRILKVNNFIRARGSTIFGWAGGKCDAGGFSGGAVQLVN